MTKYILLIFFCFLNFSLSAQVAGAKEYSKIEALYKAKAFVIQEILKDSQEVVEFDIDPLAASVTGEVTSLVYKCSEKDLEGLVFGFYGNFWNETGNTYQGYAFKNLNRAQALELFSKVSKAITEHGKYLSNDVNNHNIYFMYEDLTFLISMIGQSHSIRIFWNGFDAEWTITAFNRTKKRFEKTLDK